MAMRSRGAAALTRTVRRRPSGPPRRAARSTERVRVGRVLRRLPEQVMVRSLATASTPATPAAAAPADPKLALDPTWEKLARKELKGVDMAKLFWNTPEVCRPAL